MVVLYMIYSFANRVCTTLARNTAYIGQMSVRGEVSVARTALRHLRYKTSQPLTNWRHIRIDLSVLDGLLCCIPIRNALLAQKSLATVCDLLRTVSSSSTVLTNEYDRSWVALSCCNYLRTDLESNEGTPHIIEALES